MWPPGTSEGTAVSGDVSGCGCGCGCGQACEGLGATFDLWRRTPSGPTDERKRQGKECSNARPTVCDWMGRKKPWAEISGWGSADRQSQKRSIHNSTTTGGTTISMPYHSKQYAHLRYSTSSMLHSVLCAVICMRFGACCARVHQAKLCHSMQLQLTTKSSTQCAEARVMRLHPRFPSLLKNQQPNPGQNKHSGKLTLPLVQGG